MDKYAGAFFIAFTLYLIGVGYAVLYMRQAPVAVYYGTSNN